MGISAEPFERTPSMMLDPWNAREFPRPARLAGPCRLCLSNLDDTLGCDFERLSKVQDYVRSGKTLFLDRGRFSSARRRGTLGWQTLVKYTPLHLDVF